MKTFKKDRLIQEIDNSGAPELAAGLPASLRSLELYGTFGDACLVGLPALPRPLPRRSTCGKNN